MDFYEEYQSKLTTAENAVKVVKSGDWVDYGWCLGTPVVLDKALAARYNELTDVKLRGGVVMHPLEISKVPDAGKHFTWNSWHMSGIERKMISLGMAYYSPMRYSELPRFYRENLDPVDVVMIQVAPMDEHGYFNFGPSASHITAMCEKAKTIIVEVNQNMPRCLGGFNEGIHINKVDMVVEGPNDPVDATGAEAPATEVDKAVA